jgi:hypothetical protein
MTSITSKTAASATGFSGLLASLWNALAASVADGEFSQKLREDAGIAGDHGGSQVSQDLSREMMRRSF